MSAPLQKYLRRMWRAQLSDGALLSLHEAAEAMPGNPRLAAGWISANVAPAGEWLGQPVYRWGDVAAALATTARAAAAAPDAWLSTAEAADRMGVARNTLDQMVARSPRDLPGAPVLVGGGQRRRHLRWDAGQLAAWLPAYRAWEEEERERRSRPHAAKRKTTGARRAEPAGEAVDWAAEARGR